MAEPHTIVIDPAIQWAASIVLSLLGGMVTGVKVAHWYLQGELKKLKDDAACTDSALGGVQLAASELNRRVSVLESQGAERDRRLQVSERFQEKILGGQTEIMTALVSKLK